MFVKGLFILSVILILSGGGLLLYRVGYHIWDSSKVYLDNIAFALLAIGFTTNLIVFVWASRDAYNHQGFSWWWFGSLAVLLAFVAFRFLK